MSEVNLGNQLNQIVIWSRNLLFDQGELAQLSYNAFDYSATAINNGDKDEIELNIPVGYTPFKTTIMSNRKFKKQELVDRYAYLSNNQLSINGLYQLVTIIEAMLGDIVRAIIMKYPNKLGTMKSINTGVVLAAKSIEEIQLHVINSALNELSYKSPKDFSDSIKLYISINLLECPAFHKYIEAKATRDIYIHNRGVANEIYCNKAESHARVKPGNTLPVPTQYFLESYEYCIQLTEWLEEKLHEKWPSSEFEIKEKAKIENKKAQQLN